MIPLHIPYYAQNARDSVKNFVLGQNEQDFHAILAQRFETQFGLRHTYLTKSCTNALEITALLADLKPGDEVIVPSYTFVSTANAFAIFGAKIVFADSSAQHPNVSVETMLSCVTAKTKVMVVMHYGGVGVEDLERLRKECDARNIFLIEDAAHCIGAYHHQQHLGTIGHASVFSFHESKNISCIEGGMLVINHLPWLNRVDQLMHKGTNRMQFEQNLASFYEWVDLGSSYRMDKLHAALLTEQVAAVNEVNGKRLELYNVYKEQLLPLINNGDIYFALPSNGSRHNAHNFWITLNNNSTREKLRKHLLEKGVFTTFHYLSLHKSPFGKKYSPNLNLPNSDKFQDTLLRLPLYFQLPFSDQEKVINELNAFFRK